MIVERKQATKPLANSAAQQAGRWHSRVDTLVTALCMGGRHYANAATQQGPSPTLPKEQRRLALPHAPQREFEVIATHYGRSPDERAEIARKADSARVELEAQTGIPAKHWYQLALAVMARPDLLAWLEAQGLLPSRPAP